LIIVKSVFYLSIHGIKVVQTVDGNGITPFSNEGHRHDTYLPAGKPASR
jgi:hypothetical protein